MTLKRLGHTAIRVENVSKAVEFYHRLGMANVWQDDDWAYMKVGTHGLALLGPEYPAEPHFGFLFHDFAELEAEHTRLQQAGIEVEPVHSHRDGSSSFYGRDPDGNLFEFLYEPLATAADPID